MHGVGSYMNSVLLIILLVFIPVSDCLSQIWSGDTLRLNPITFEDPSPEGWNAQYKTVIDFPEDDTQWSKILMLQSLKCDSATAGDNYPCGEWDYVWNTLLSVPSGDSIELFSIGSFVTPYGKRLKLGPENKWTWRYDISEYAPLLKGKRELVTGNNQELLDLQFLFIKGTPTRNVITVENIYPYGDYKYEYLATDSLLQERELILSGDAAAYRLKAVVSGHGHAGPRNCCEWDSKMHAYVLNKWETYEWNVWKDCGNNPIYPQGGTWPFDRAGWCPGTKVDEYEFEITPKVTSGDTVLIDYNIEYFRDNGEKDGTFRMAHQIFSYGPPNFKNDAAVVEILSPNTEDRYARANPDCGNPRIIIQNLGAYPLKQLTIRYGIDGRRKSKYEWQGDLQFLESEQVVLPTLNWKKFAASGTFEVVLETAKGIKDESLQNNRLISNYSRPMHLPDTFVLALHTNNLGRAAENQYLINDASGVVWYHNDALEDSTLYRIPITLSKGCYQFRFRDDMEDGISRHWWNRNAAPDQVGINGSIRFESLEGDTLVSFNPDFGQELLLNFIVE